MSRQPNRDMLASKAVVGNIEDAEGFVRARIRASNIVLTADEHDELMAEGLVLLCELHQRYDPQRDNGGTGRTQGFYGYALYLLPRKLNDAWHRSQEHHLLRTQPDGTRKYEYLRTAESLDKPMVMHEDGGTYDRGLHDGNCRTAGNFVPIPLQKAAA